MYEDHPYFKVPPNELTEIWKYMDFVQFISLLDRRELYFRRSSKFEDPYEGSYSNANLSEINLLEQTNENPILLNNLKSMLNVSKIWKDSHFINCWHMSDYESAAMWKLYSNDSKGISIKSNFKKLRDSFFQCDHPVYIGMVNYIDWNKEIIPRENALAPFTYKRLSFGYEKEIRALIGILDENEDGKYYIDHDSNIKKFKCVIKDGVYVNVDLKTLIEQIYVSPKAEIWFVDLVKSVCKKYNIDERIVNQSKLYEGSLY